MAKKPEDAKTQAAAAPEAAAPVTPPAAPEGAQDSNTAPQDAAADSPAADAQDAPQEAAPVAAPAAPAAPAESKAPEEIKQPETKKAAAAADPSKKVVFTTDVTEAEGYVKQGYLVRHVRHEGVMGYKVFLTQKVNALGTVENVVSKA